MTMTCWIELEGFDDVVGPGTGATELIVELHPVEAVIAANETMQAAMDARKRFTGTSNEFRTLRPF